MRAILCFDALDAVVVKLPTWLCREPCGPPCHPGAEDIQLMQPQARATSLNSFGDLDGQDPALLIWAAGAAPGTGLLTQCGQSLQLVEHLIERGVLAAEEWCASFAQDIRELVDAVRDYGECDPQAARRLADGLARLRLERGALASGLLAATVSELPGPASPARAAGVPAPAPAAFCACGLERAACGACSQGWAQVGAAGAPGAAMVAPTGSPPAAAVCAEGNADRVQPDS